MSVLLALGILGMNRELSKVAGASVPEEEFDMKILNEIRWSA